MVSNKELKYCIQRIQRKYRMDRRKKVIKVLPAAVSSSSGDNVFH